MIKTLLNSKKTGDFLQKRDGDVLRAVTMAKKPRRNISTVVGDKAITRDEAFVKIQEYKSVSEETKSRCSKNQIVKMSPQCHPKRTVS